MNRSHNANMIAVLLLASVLGARAHAQSMAGTCAGVQGSVEIQHAGAWRDAEVGAAVSVGDRLRTGAHSRATVVFRDDSVIDLAPDTELGIEAQEIDDAGRRHRSLLHLVAGKVRAWVSAAYREARSRYELETPTALIAVRGTEFIVVYDRAAEITEVVGLEGHVEVHAKLAVMGAGVEVGPRALTRVAKGRFPTALQRVNDARLPRYVEGVDLVGTGRRDGLNVLHPAVLGRMLAPQDVPGPGEEPGNDGAEESTAPIVHAPLPGSVADRLSPDVYTNTQPLRDYQQTPPGAVPPSATGGVHVGF
jgi:hypothetical protein